MTACVLVSVALASPAAGLTLVDTTAKVLDTSHDQVETPGGSQAHLLRIATSLKLIGSAIDADVLLADGDPLVMTWRRDAGDADLIDFSLAMAIDSAPCHLEVTLRRDEAPVPGFDAVGDVSSNGSSVAIGLSRVIVHFDTPLGALDDVCVGDVPPGVLFPGGFTEVWRIDLSPLTEGGQFDIVLRAGPPGDFDDDDDVDLADYAEFYNCFELTSPSDPCKWFFDLDADNDLDLGDFAMFQVWFSGTDTPVACGGGR